MTIEHFYDGRVLVFRDDDHGYLTWLRDHFMGYVINAERSLSPSSELKLHEAACATISGQPPGGTTWTGPSIKVCAAQRTDLQRWVREHTKAKLSRCGTCAP